VGSVTVGTSPLGYVGSLGVNPMHFRAVRYLFVLVAAAAMLRCGGSSTPASPSGVAGGVKLQGVVLQNATGTSASAGVSAMSAKAGKVVVTVRENPSLSVTVSGNGTFEIQSLPAGGFTLVFSVNGVVVGQITITAVSEGTTIKIVVKLSDHDVELVDLETDDDNGQGGDKTCMINGGTAGTNIELEGNVASGDSTLFKMRVNGNRASGLVDVAAAGASYKCNGDKGTAAECMAKLKAGVKVHVKGNLTACTTSMASVTATQVMIQKD
jgi:hypothetical protein